MRAEVLHGLPLIGRADWNDCLNLNCFSETPDEPYQTTANREGRTAESVFIAGMFVLYGPDYAAMAETQGQPEEAARAREHVARMEQTVLEHGWDGEWFLRAYDYFGNKVGIDECEEGKIFIEPQGFCAMAGIGKETGEARLALDSVKERLDTPYGIVLNQPEVPDARIASLDEAVTDAGLVNLDADEIEFRVLRRLLHQRVAVAEADFQHHRCAAAE